MNSNNELTTKHLNQRLHNGILLRLHFKADIGQAVVQPDDNGTWNHQAVRAAIYANMPDNWLRFTVRSIEITEPLGAKVVVNFARENDLEELCEAWGYFLGGVITDPPVRDY